jgi:hypothetical protein
MTPAALGDLVCSSSTQAVHRRWCTGAVPAGLKAVPHSDSQLLPTVAYSTADRWAGSAGLMDRTQRSPLATGSASAASSAGGTHFGHPHP